MTDAAHLLPCPFPSCGGAASFERLGTPRQSCIIVCDSCGCRLETSEEGARCGTQWNDPRATAPQAEPAPISDERIREGYRGYDMAINAAGQTRWQVWRDACAWMLAERGKPHD